MNAEAEKILEKYIKGSASPEEQIEAYKWITAHPEHHKEYLLEKRLYELSIFHDNLLPKKERNIEGKRFILRKLIRYVAVACLVVAAFFFRGLLGDDINDASLQVISVPVGQQTSITLSDGTSIDLGSNTELTIASDFGRKERRVYLEGSAYFDVVGNTKKPFIVSSEQANVIVTGTSFYVDAISQYDVFKTSLVEGEVRIDLKNKPNETITLQSKQQGVLKEGKLVVQSTVDYDEFLWRKGLIAFRAKTLEEILSLFQIYYNVTFVVENELVTAKTHMYTGKFYLIDGLDYALGILKEQVGFTYERDEVNRIVYIR